MHYAIGDVHGCYDELMALLKTIEERDADARYIFVGDFIDRGPKVWETLMWAMDNITAEGKYTAVRGNHEQMAVNWYYTEFLPWWDEKEKGGTRPMPETLYDFSLLAVRQKIDRPDILKYAVDFFESLPFSRRMEIETSAGRKVVYRIVHAWYRDGEEREEIQQECNLWDRNFRGNFKSDEIILHGHTPTIVPEYYRPMENNTRPGLIGYKKNDINIDGGCCFGALTAQPCMLCGLCLETLEEIYPCTIAERFMQLAQPPITKRKAKRQEKKYLADHAQVPNAYREELVERYFTASA